MHHELKFLLCNLVAFAFIVDGGNAQANTYKFAPIPGGTYEIGNVFNPVISVFSSEDNPVRAVTLSPYFMAVNDTTKAQWDTVRTWALTHGYTDLAVGAGKASNHPVQTVNWYDVVKWANAASEKDGLTPCYSFGATVYRKGEQNDVTCDWSANGYRLPTEAEWEVAARGGLIGKRFPWAEPTISHKKANYTARRDNDEGDLSAGTGRHPAYKKKGEPCTSPVGSFAPNGYGLCDMAGNISQWCWDLYGDTVGGSAPRGADAGPYRVLRGGNWTWYAFSLEVAHREFGTPWSANNFMGFRLARGRP